MIVVSDTSSLCGLGIVGHLLLLQQIYIAATRPFDLIIEGLFPCV